MVKSRQFQYNNTAILSWLIFFFKVKTWLFKANFMHIKNVFLEPWFTAYTILEGQILKEGIFGLRLKETLKDVLPGPLYETGPFLSRSSAPIGDYFQGMVCSTEMALRTPPRPLTFQVLRAFTQAHTHIPGASSKQYRLTSEQPASQGGRRGRRLWGQPVLSLPVRVSCYQYTHIQYNSLREPWCVWKASQTELCRQVISRTLWRRGQHPKNEGHLHKTWETHTHNGSIPQPHILYC